MYWLGFCCARASRSRRVRRGRGGGVEERQLLHVLGMRRREHAGKRSAPSVPHQDELLAPQMIGEGADVLDEVLGIVLIDGRWLRREIVAAHIGRDRQMVLAELFALRLPLVPE